jgi:hypothetical protein
VRCITLLLHLLLATTYGIQDSVCRYQIIEVFRFTVGRQNAVALMERDWWNLKTRPVRQTLMQSLQYKLVPMPGISHVTTSAVYPKHGSVMGMTTA